MTISNRQILIDQLKSYGQLCEGWDGDNSFPPTEEHIHAVISFVNKIPDNFETPSCMISSDGKIGLYWSNELLYADIEFEDADENISNELMSLYIRNRDNQSDAYFDNILWADCTPEWFAMIFKDFI